MGKSNVRVVLRARPTANFANENFQFNEGSDSIDMRLPKEEGAGHVNNQQESWHFKVDKVLVNSSQESVFETCASDVVKSVMEVADTDDDGVISYEEFLPVAIDIVQTVYAKTMQAKKKERADLEATVRKIFNSYDVDRNGYLDAGEFNAVFEALSSELGSADYSERLATEVMSVVDADEDNHVSLEEFTPLCAEVLRVLIDEAENAKYEAGNTEQTGGTDYMAAAEEILLKGLSDEDLERTLLELFQSADLDNSGTLERPEFTKCLLEADIGLTEKHVSAILKDVDTNEDGLVDFVEFAPLAYGLLLKVIAAQLEEEDKAAAPATYDTANLGRAKEIVKQLSKEELESTLMTIFQAADTNGSGALDRLEFRGCLLQANLGLTEDVIELLMTKVDANADNLISYEEFAPLCYEILVEVVSKELDDNDAEQAAVEEAEGQLLEEAEAYLVQGFSKDELQELLKGVFEEMDTDGSKHLDPDEFKRALALSDLKLTPEEVDQVLEAIDTDGDGKISYEEFIPIAFRILVEITRDELVEAAGGWVCVCVCPLTRVPLPLRRSRSQMQQPMHAPTARRQCSCTVYPRRSLLKLFCKFSKKPTRTEVAVSTERSSLKPSSTRTSASLKKRSTSSDPRWT